MDKKASDADLINSYKKTFSVWRVAEEFGMCGQTVHERLKKLNVRLKGQKFSEHEIRRIIEVYTHEEPLERGNGKLDILSAELGRIKPSISRMARKLGISNIKRKCSNEHNKIVSERMKKQWKILPHPRGMSGKKHSIKTKENLSKISKIKWAEKSDDEKHRFVLQMSINARKQQTNREKASWKCGWRQIGKKKNYYRSGWEANYARYLEYLKFNNKILSWEHEPQVFRFDGIKSGQMSYLPDFKIIYLDGSIEFHEIKGWMDERSKIQIERMKSFYPDKKLTLICGKEYRLLEKKVRHFISDWEK